MNIIFALVLALLAYWAVGPHVVAWFKAYVFRFPRRPNIVCDICGVDATEKGCTRTSEDCLNR